MDTPVADQPLPRRPLGSSGFDVSIMSLGSWRTFERIPREQGVEVMNAAREAGINFLDDARYDDETGKAPIHQRHSRSKRSSNRWPACSGRGRPRRP
jgi:predicted aldo/keto reductase-like oxidoreductase